MFCCEKKSPVIKDSPFKYLVQFDTIDFVEKVVVYYLVCLRENYFFTF